MHRYKNIKRRKREGKKKVFQMPYSEDWVH